MLDRSLVVSEKNKAILLMAEATLYPLCECAVFKLVRGALFAPTLSSQPATRHSLSFIITIVILTLR